jgi:hypothetical protein
MNRQGSYRIFVANSEVGTHEAGSELEEYSRAYIRYTCTQVRLKIRRKLRREILNTKGPKRRSR